MRAAVLLAALLAAPAIALADCGGNGQCCTEPDGSFVCRGVGLAGILVTRDSYPLRTTAGWQVGDAGVVVQAANVVTPTTCTFESNSLFRLQRREPSFESRFSTLLVAKTTTAIVDFVAKPSIGAACTIDVVMVR